jgi:hypothetical protein
MDGPWLVVRYGRKVQRRSGGRRGLVRASPSGIGFVGVMSGIRCRAWAVGVRTRSAHRNLSELDRGTSGRVQPSATRRLSRAIG